MPKLNFGMKRPDGGDKCQLKMVTHFAGMDALRKLHRRRAENPFQGCKWLSQQTIFTKTFKQYADENAPKSSAQNS